MIRTGKTFILCAAATCLVALPACHRDPPLPPGPAADDTNTLDGTALANFTGDPEAGARGFTRCQPCHSVDPDRNGVGPSLAHIVGQPAARVASYTHYSPQLRDSHIVWTPEKLFQYLERPTRTVPGTHMVFAGLVKPQDRADVIAWLRTQ